MKILAFVFAGTPRVVLLVCLAVRSAVQEDLHWRRWSRGTTNLFHDHSLCSHRKVYDLYGDEDRAQNAGRENHRHDDFMSANDFFEAFFHGGAVRQHGGRNGRRFSLAVRCDSIGRGTLFFRKTRKIRYGPYQQSYSRVGWSCYGPLLNKATRHHGGMDHKVRGS